MLDQLVLMSDQKACMNMIECHISTNLLVQYILVTLIIIGAIGWIILKIRNSRKKGAIGCCGCSIASSCPSCQPQSLLSKQPCPSCQQQSFSSKQPCPSCQPQAIECPSCCKATAETAKAAEAGSVVEPLGETSLPPSKIENRKAKIE